MEKIFLFLCLEEDTNSNTGKAEKAGYSLSIKLIENLV